MAKGFETLDHVGSFLGGVAGLTAAGIALFGFDVWKRQITHGKYLTLIWDAMVANERLQSHISHACVNLLFRYQSNHNEHFTDAVLADRKITEMLISTLKESCSAIDVLAARNGVELSNICGFLDSRLISLNRYADEKVDMNPAGDINPWATKLSDHFTLVSNEADLLRQKLAGLEKKFG